MITLSKISDFFTNTKRGIHSTIKWLPVIWKDRQWDHEFFNVILKHKLELMSEFYKHYGCHINAKTDAEKMDTCIQLLDRIIKDEYHENTFLDHDKKWGKSELTTKDIPNSEFTELNVNRPFVKSAEDKSKEREESRFLFKHSENLKNKDVEMLYKIISDNILCWWD